MGKTRAIRRPPGADRWSAFSRTDILSSLNDEARGSPLITHGGHPPQWAIIGGWDITGGVYLQPPSTTDSPRGNVTGFEDAASAAGFAIEWATLAAASASGLREPLMVLAYESGKAVKRTIFRTPASSAIDPTVIAAQERLLLQSLLRTRDQRAGSGRHRSRTITAKALVPSSSRSLGRPGSPDRRVPRTDRMV